MTHDAYVDASQMFPIEHDEDAYIKAETCILEALQEFGAMLHERNLVLADALMRISNAETIEDAVAIAADALAEFGIAEPSEDAAGKASESA